MMLRHSLRARLIGAFSLFALLLSTVYGVTVFNTLRIVEDQVLINQLQEEVQDYLDRRQTDPQTPPPTTRRMRSYWGEDHLPNVLASFANSPPADGYYELEEQDFHIAVTTDTNSGQRLYVVYDVATLEVENRQATLLLTSLVIGGLLVTLLGIGLGAFIARIITAPVVRLAGLINETGPTQLPTGFAKRFPNDEVGLLARTLEQALQRVRAFIDREQRFTRDASHELRTPVTIIRGATELLDQSSLTDVADRALTRIKRACVDMQNTIEMFLWLGRENDDKQYDERFDVIPLIEQAISQHEYLLADKNLSVTVQRLAEPELTGPTQAFTVAVSNLIRNAFEHTSSGCGPVTVAVNAEAVIVSNRAGLAEPSDQLYQRGVRGGASQGFGLGLDIVQRLCQRCGWRLELKSTVEGVAAQLNFSPSS